MPTLTGMKPDGFYDRNSSLQQVTMQAVIGWATERQRVPLAASVLLVSGRASFELTQKAVMAGIPVLAAVSAPSSLAVSLAEESGITLVAFLRKDSMNIYTRADRIT